MEHVAAVVVGSAVLDGSDGIDNNVRADGTCGMTSVESAEGAGEAVLAANTLGGGASGADVVSAETVADALGADTVPGAGGFEHAAGSAESVEDELVLYEVLAKGDGSTWTERAEPLVS